MDTFESMFQTGIGFGATAGGARFVYRGLLTGLNTPIGRVGTHLGVTLIETLVLGYIGGPRFATRALTGGLLATGWQGLTELVSGTPAADYIPTLGEGAETEEFRKAIEQEVLKEIRGGGVSGYSQDRDGMSIYLQPAGVSETYLSPAGASAYLTEGEAERAEHNVGVSAYLTEGEVDRITGMGDAETEFSSESAPERF